MHPIVVPTLAWLVAVTAGSPAGIGAVTWLEGCWQDAAPGRTIDERWSAPRDGVMEGTSRTVRDGRLVSSESVVLRERGDVLAYEAHPSEQSPAVFLSTHVGERAVVFENLDHDFPQRIGYEQKDPAALLAWIEEPGATGRKRIEFRYRRVTCSNP